MNKNVLIILMIISILFISGCNQPKINISTTNCCEMLNLDGTTESCSGNLNQIDCSSTYIGQGGYNYYNQDCDTIVNTNGINPCSGKLICVNNGLKYSEGSVFCSEDKRYLCTSENIQQICDTCSCGSILSENNKNNIPSVSGVYLNSTSGTNLIDSDLILNWTNTDVDGNNTKNITNWYLNNQPLILLNLPFEGGSNDTYTKDYSNFNVIFDVFGAKFNSTGGYDGFGAYEFNGSGAYMNSETHMNYITLPVSISVWIKPKNLGGGIFISDDTSVYNSGNHAGIWLETYPGVIITFGNGGGASLANRRTFETPLVANQWSHIVGVITDSSNIQIYINGVNIPGVYSGSATNMVHMNYDPRIGVRSRYGPFYFNGTIDDLQIWNRSLSAEEVRLIFENKSQYILSSNELSEGNWYANVITNDGVNDSIPVNSNLMTMF